MKTIIRNGKEYKVSNKLYEEINRLGLLEADTTTNPQTPVQPDLFGNVPSQEEIQKQKESKERSEAIKKGLSDKKTIEAYKQLVRPLVANMRVFVSKFDIYTQKIKSNLDDQTKEKLITLFNGLIKSFNEDKEFIGMVIANVLNNPELPSAKAKRENIINYILDQGDKQNFGQNELKAVEIVLKKDEFNSMKDAFKEIIGGEYSASERQLNYYRYNVIKGSVEFIEGLDPKENLHMVDYPTRSWEYRLAPLKAVLSVLNHYQLTNEEAEVIKKKMPETSNYKFNTKDVLSEEEKKNNKEQLTLAFRILLYFDNGVKKFLIDNREAIVDSLLKKKIDPNGREWSKIYFKLWKPIIQKIYPSFVDKLQTKKLDTVELPYYFDDNPVKGFVKSDKSAKEIWGRMIDPNRNLW